MGVFDLVNFRENTCCLSPNHKILSATCEVAIKLRNIAFQQVLPIVKVDVAHAFGKL